MESKHIYEHIDADETSGIHFELSEVTSSYVPLHIHNAIEIISITEGELTVEAENSRYDLSAGQCILLRANEPHSTISLTGNKAILVQLPLAFLEHYIPDVERRYFGWNPVTENPHELTKIQWVKDVLQKMAVLEEFRPDGGQIRFQGYIFELVYLLYHDFSSELLEAPAKNNVKDADRLDQLFRFTEEHYMEQITLEEAADVVHMQVNYFCRFFKAHTGKTFITALNEHRLSKIYKDLIETDVPIKDLLEKHGFTNYKLFRKMFYERFGMTPRELRKRSE